MHINAVSFASNTVYAAKSTTPSFNGYFSRTHTNEYDVLENRKQSVVEEILQILPYRYVTDIRNALGGIEDLQKIKFYNLLRETNNTENFKNRVDFLPVYDEESKKLLENLEEKCSSMYDKKVLEKKIKEFQSILSMMEVLRYKNSVNEGKQFRQPQLSFASSL